MNNPRQHVKVDKGESVIEQNEPYTVNTGTNIYEYI